MQGAARACAWLLIGGEEIRKPIVEWEGSIYDGLSSDEEDEDFVALKLVDGVKIWIHHALPVEQVTWHRKGDYFASVSPTSTCKSFTASRRPYHLE